MYHDDIHQDRWVVRLNSSPFPQRSSFNSALRVVGYIATRAGDAERGPQIRVNPADARFHMLADGEVVWVHGPRGEQVAPLLIDEAVAPHTCVVRDLAGLSVSEAVHVSKPDLDSPRRIRV